jgi:hypothetical protein
MEMQNVFYYVASGPPYFRIQSFYFFSPGFTISFPEHARSQVKGGRSSGEIELIQACDWLTADSTLDFQREFYACLAMQQNINKVFGISRRKFDTFYTEID